MSFIGGLNNISYDLQVQDDITVVRADGMTIFEYSVQNNENIMNANENEILGNIDIGDRTVKINIKMLPVIVDIYGNM